MKTDIIVPTKNGISDTVQMFESLKQTTKDYRLIIVDSASSDGTSKFFKSQDVQVLEVENRGFGFAINEGFKIIESENIVILNNDTILTEGWLEGLYKAREIGGEMTGFVGPVSNYAASHQKIEISNVGSLEEFAAQRKLNFDGQIQEVGTLGFFCTLLSSKMIQELGPLEMWGAGGYEDTDYCIRAWDKGWTAILSLETFVFHHGGQTFQREFGNQKKVLENADQYFSKNARQRRKNLSIVALYRVQNNHKCFELSLEHTSKQVDEIYVFDDRSDPSLESLIKKFSKVTRYFHKEKSKGFNEYEDRDTLLEWAKESDHDWALVLDSDEWLEDYVTFEKLHNLVRVPDPIIRQFVFSEFTFWRDDFYRDDGPWAKQLKGRLFRIGPAMKLKAKGTLNGLQGLHCSASPWYPEECRRSTTFRILHYGYNSEELRSKKYKFYQEGDTEKNINLIGASDYSHLIDENQLLLKKFQPDNHVSLNMIVQSSEFLNVLEIIKSTWGTFAEILIHIEPNNISDANINLLSEVFQAKIIHGESQNLSVKRNLLLFASSEKWIFSFDPDERIEGLQTIRQMIDYPTDGWMFWIKNLMKDGRYSISERVRLFKKSKAIGWQGAIHEQIEINGNISVSPVPILHLGYLLDDDALKKKMQRYEITVREGLKENPDDPTLLFSLALHLRNQGKRGEGLQLLQRAIQINPNFLQAKVELSLELLRESNGLLSSSMSLMPDSYPLKAGFQGLLKNLEDFLT